MYQYLAEFLGALFFIYIILATGNPLAIGAALALTILMTSNISVVILIQQLQLPWPLQIN